MDLVNVGAVSNSVLPDLLARCVLLDAHRAGYRVWHRSVSYNREAVIAAAYDVRYPGAEYIERYMRGRIQPGWVNAKATAWASQGTV